LDRVTFHAATKHTFEKTLITLIPSCYEVVVRERAGA